MDTLNDGAVDGLADETPALDVEAVDTSEAETSTDAHSVQQEADASAEASPNATTDTEDNGEGDGPVSGESVTESKNARKRRLRKEREQARERELKELRARLARYEDSDAQPERGDYDSDAEYIADLSAWKVRRQFSEERKGQDEATVARLEREAVDD